MRSYEKHKQSRTKKYFASKINQQSGFERSAQGYRRRYSSKLRSSGERDLCTVQEDEYRLVEFSKDLRGEDLQNDDHYPETQCREERHSGFWGESVSLRSTRKRNVIVSCPPREITQSASRGFLGGGNESNSTKYSKSVISRGGVRIWRHYTTKNEFCKTFVPASYNPESAILVA